MRQGTLQSRNLRSSVQTGPCDMKMQKYNKLRSPVNQGLAVFIEAISLTIEASIRQSIK